MENEAEIREGYIEIPKDYRWCTECTALTPHIKNQSPDFPWQKDYEYCVICGNDVDTESYLVCPVCCWSYESYYENISDIMVQVHHPRCHYKEEEFNDENEILYLYNQYGSYAEKLWREFIRENQQFKKIKEITCSCPEYLIITDPYCYKNTGGYGNGTECMNDTWWNLSIRCPICGERFEIEDSSC